MSDAADAGPYCGYLRPVARLGEPIGAAAPLSLLVWPYDEESNDDHCTKTACGVDEHISCRFPGRMGLTLYPANPNGSR